METETMETIIAAAEKRGWRISALSHVWSGNQYSCILERKKKGDDGFPVYALGDLSPDPKAAILSAWGHAQRPIGNPRVAARRSGEPQPGSTDTPLGEYLSRNVGTRVRLEDALRDLNAAHTGQESEDDDGW